MNRAKALTASLLLLAAARSVAQAPNPLPVTGNVTSVLGNGQAYAGISIQLLNCASPVAIAGYSVIVQQQYLIQANGSGVVNSTVWPNDIIDCNGTTGNSEYRLSYVANGAVQGTPQCFQVLSTQGAWNINTQQPITCSQSPPNPQDGQYNNLNVLNCFSIKGGPCVPATGGLLIGSGTVGTLSSWATSTSLGNSNISENGGTATVAENATIGGNEIVDGNATVATTTAATSSTAVPSPTLLICGNVWSGSLSICDGLGISVTYNTTGGFTNPPPTFNFNHVGSSTAAEFNFSASVSVTSLSGVSISQGGNGFFTDSTTPATGGGNVNSPPLQLAANFLNATPVSTLSIALLKNIVGTGQNPPVALTLSYSGANAIPDTTGVHSVDMTAAAVVKVTSCTGCVLTGTITYTTATSDNATVTGATASSHCWSFPTNATAAANTVVPYVSSVTTNTVTITHVVTTASGGTANVFCTPN